MSSGPYTPQYTKLKANFRILCQELSDKIGPGPLSDRLLACKIITTSEHENAHDPNIPLTERMNNLLSWVLNSVKLDSGIFNLFMDVLQEYPDMKFVVDVLKGMRMSVCLFTAIHLTRESLDFVGHLQSLRCVKVLFPTHP